ncbi:hypothetical protein HWV62_9998 [Athelia sp. TMB]|nr:hypothetical protein HWV62_9998 [Athelia sp. TMB]
MTRSELDRVFNNIEMKKRTKQFAILGMSLSNLLDIHQPQDLLRGLLNTLTEYEQSKEEGDKPKKRSGVGGFADYSYSESPEASYLVAPHMPFPLDYHQTLLSLLDVLSEVYAKISRILGPSPFPHSSQHMMGPLGLLAPHPGVSYLFSGPDSANKEDLRDEGSLWGIAHGSVTQNPVGGAMAGYANAGPGLAAGGMSSPPPSWTPALADMVLKVDVKFKKITSVLLKELDAFARNGIKDELASLDPLLRNMAVADGAREQYDFEGYL